MNRFLFKATLDLFFKMMVSRSDGIEYFIEYLLFLLKKRNIYILCNPIQILMIVMIT